MRLIYVIIGFIAVAGYFLYKNVSENVTVKTTGWSVSNTSYSVVVNMVVKNNSVVPIIANEVHAVLRHSNKSYEITSTNKVNLNVPTKDSQDITFIFSMATISDIINSIFDLGDIEGFYVSVYMTIAGIKFKHSDWHLNESNK